MDLPLDSSALSSKGLGGDHADPSGSLTLPTRDSALMAYIRTLGAALSLGKGQLLPEHRD